MVKKAAVILVGALFAVACDQSSYSQNPSMTGPAAPNSSGSPTSNSTLALAPQGQGRVGFGLNGTVSGFPTGTVFLTGGGAYSRAADTANAGGGFTCVDAVLQGPLHVSINPNDPGPCGAGEGVRWDTAALLTSTTFKCTGAATEGLKTATTSDKTVVLQADFYRASNGNEESFTAQIIASDGDIAPDLPGVQNLWVQGVGCGTAIVNFSK